MKTKSYLFLSLILGLVGLSTSCDDTIDSIGSGIQPGDNKITVFDMSLDIQGKTVRLGLDSIYAKSTSCLFGRFDHPVYGSIKGEFACQFYPSAAFEIDSMVKNEIDSIQLKLFFYNYHGDSLAPMEASVYPLIKPLDDNYFLNTNLMEYADSNSPLGKKAYTARDLTISDSLNNANNNNVSYIIPKSVTINLPKKLGQEILEEYKKGNNGAFVSADRFAEFFPGVYVASTFGEGCLLDVSQSDIYIYYERERTKPSEYTGKDTVYIETAFTTLEVTKEVVLRPNYISQDDENLLQEDKDKLYIKTPAGVFPKITIPLSQIVDSIGNRKFSNVQLKISAYPKENDKYSWNFPGTGESVGVFQLEKARSKMLLIEADSVLNFFNQQKIADNLTSYFTTYNSLTQSYTYNNIANMIQNAINKKSESESYKDMELLLIPVTVSYYDETDSYGNPYTVDYAASHYLYPSAVTLKQGGNNLKIQIVAAEIGGN